MVEARRRRSALTCCEARMRFDGSRALVTSASLFKKK